MLFEYVLRLDLSRPFLVLLSAYTWVLLLLFRLTAGRVVGVLRREFVAPHQIMIAGTGERAIRLATALEESSEYDVRLRGFLSELPNPPAEITLRSLYTVWPVGDLPSILREHVVDEIIFAVGSESLADLEDVFCCATRKACARASRWISSLTSTARFRSTASATPPCSLSLPRHTMRSGCWSNVSTDVVDRGGGPGAAAALDGADRIADPPHVARSRHFPPGPLRVERTAFRVLQIPLHVRKRRRAEGAVAHLNTRNVAFKIPDDPRLTPVGRYLRKFSDRRVAAVVERAEAAICRWWVRARRFPSEVEQYRGWQRRRLRMRPGLTCLWALCRARQPGFRDLDEDGYAVH